ncbi:hypothetical protein NUV25_03330 [Burkholderia pseudomultivorans]|uniref:hypothetical protein n=1 Tax=Burkholderia pseudomultivorans TaxID=1207504 RepID=UPI0028755CF3|nr:hypothetical protein [Burkholderia pseudomultivorans]MDS0856732.1 hypothetical protein [Burkholderia pseudomultivorans]
MSAAAANARGVLRTVVVASETDQPMIESGAGTVYEAIVRRKSRPAIWRDMGRAGAAAARVAEISACPAAEFRNLGTAPARPFRQTKRIPFKSTVCKINQKTAPGTDVA